MLAVAAPREWPVTRILNVGFALTAAFTAGRIDPRTSVQDRTKPNPPEQPPWQSPPEIWVLISTRIPERKSATRKLRAVSDPRKATTVRLLVESTAT